LPDLAPAASAAPPAGDAVPERPELIPSSLRFEDAFNRNVVLAALFVGVVMLPGAIYMGLVAGVGLGGAAEWVTLILFLETARRTFVTLKPQELMLIYWAAGAMIGVSGAFGSGLHTFGGSFGLFIWEQYLIHHPLLKDIAPKIPDWVVPPLGSEAYAKRTFFHSAWTKPILLGMVVTVLMTLNRVTLGYVLFRATADAERLPFPLVNIDVGGTMALAESSAGREGWRWRVFSIGAMIGVAWGLIYVVVPVLTSAISPQPILLVPIPWIDLTTAIQAVLPGALFGLSTGLGGYLWGMVLPREIAWGQFAGSMIGGLLIPPVLFAAGALPDWKPGYASVPTSIALNWNFWISFGMGVGLLFGWAGIVAMIRQTRRRRLELRDAAAAAGAPPPERGRLGFPKPPEGRGDFNPAVCLILWAASTIGLIALVKWLVPDFPVWITALFGILWTPLNSFITARMVGITGSQTGAPFPFLREFTFFLSGYRGVDLWFAPVPLYDHGFEARTFKQLEMSRTKFTSLVKFIALATVLTFVFSGLYWSLIWRLGPIPSSAYPYAQTYWPLGAQNQYIWLSITDPDSPTRAYFIQQVLNVKFIGLGVAVAAALWWLTSMLKLPQLFFFAMIGSFQTWPHDAIPVAIGAIVGFRLGRKYGTETWSAYAPILGAGFACGMGLIGMVAIAITLMAKATTPLLY
jgi:hypothetical protein